MLIRANIKDADAWHWSGETQPNWHKVDERGPYKWVFTISGNASFEKDRDVKTATAAGSSDVVNIPVYVSENWTGGDLTVSITAKDDADSATPTGTEIVSRQDEDGGKTMIFSKIPDPPSTIYYVGDNISTPNVIFPEIPHPDWGPPGQFLHYQVGPKAPPVYVGGTIQEYLSPVTADFVYADLSPAGVTAAQGEVNPDRIARIFWPSGADETFGENSTLPIGENDIVTDHHNTSIDEVKYFTDDALSKLNGVGYSLPQTYKAGTTVLRSYTIHYRYTGRTVIIVKKE